MDLKAALDALGSTKDAIARTLRDKGIKGERRSACNCPIAQYLRTCGWSGWSRVEVSGRGVSAYDDLAPPVRVSLPAAVFSFVLAFDGGCYPELEAFC